MKHSIRSLPIVLRQLPFYETQNHFKIINLVTQDILQTEVSTTVMIAVLCSYLAFSVEACRSDGPNAIDHKIVLESPFGSRSVVGVVLVLEFPGTGTACFDLFDTDGHLADLSSADED